ncbi:hypothetical protein [Nocardia sp. NPDC056100]|uniref:hypothetical protein n=1 Tax=Nocardia sp. NPDC056100 TaxID=3345712 RepID=UPI0035D5A2E4
MAGGIGVESDCDTRVSESLNVGGDRVAVHLAQLALTSQLGGQHIVTGLGMRRIDRLEGPVPQLLFDEGQGLDHIGEVAAAVEKDAHGDYPRFCISCALRHHAGNRSLIAGTNTVVPQRIRSHTA